jgi:2-(1,2-epoxy-1,2-dihydrophenyl)acetyl-CoA isomerase
MPYKNLVFGKENHVATIRINRPEVMNALDIETHVEIHTAIREVREDSDARVLVITGTGRAFAAGRDVRQQAARVRGEALPPRDRSRPSGSPFEIGNELWNMPKPVIAAVNGVAGGGGLSIVLECDIILASENARFGNLFIRRAAAGSGFTAFLLPRLIGVHKAKELLFSGTIIDAREAEKIGLVNHVYPADDFEKKVREFAEQLARGPSKAISLVKRLVNDGLSMSIESVGRYEALTAEICTESKDMKEAVTAFIEKRTPKFEGV